MKAIFAVVVLLAVVVVGVGFYRGWFAFSSDKTDEKTNVTFTVDKDKMKDDKDSATEKMKDLGNTVKEKTGNEPEAAKETGNEPEAVKETGNEPEAVKETDKSKGKEVIQP